MDDLINYVWHLKHAPEQNIIGSPATLMLGWFFFSFAPPPDLSVVQTAQRIQWKEMLALHIVVVTPHTCVSME